MRAVIFTDAAGDIPRLLVAAAVESADQRPDFDIVGFVTSAPNTVLRGRWLRARTMVTNAAVVALGGSRRLAPTLDLPRTARQLGVPILVPEDSVNDAPFIARLHRELSPDVALSFSFQQIFSQDLLDSFDQAVNLHNGLLPDYGGLAATSHSILRGESQSGYTFHRMSRSIDRGPILMQDSVPLDASSRVAQVEKAKGAGAAAMFPDVLEAMFRNDPGTEQTPDGSYFSADDSRVLALIDDPEAIDLDELELRIRAFGNVRLPIDGSYETVTKVAPADSNAPFSFPLRGGAHARAVQLSGIPAPIVRLRQRLTAIR